MNQEDWDRWASAVMPWVVIVPVVIWLVTFLVSSYWPRGD